MPDPLFEDAARAAAARGETAANLTDQLAAARALLALCMAELGPGDGPADRAVTGALNGFKRIAFVAAEVAQENGALPADFILLIAGMGASFAGGNVNHLPAAWRPRALIMITELLAKAADVGVEVNVTASLEDAPTAEAVH